MSMQSFRSSQDFIDAFYHVRTYRGSTLLFQQGRYARLFQKGPVIFIICLVGLYVEKYTARQIRDHSLDQFVHSNSIIIRMACRTYKYLFPEGSSRKYFMEVALPDNFLTALQMETLLHMLPNSLDEPVGNNVEETILRISSVMLFVCCLDKIRQVVYRTLRRVPQRHIFNFALNFAPTGVYPVTLPNREIIQYRN